MDSMENFRKIIEIERPSKIRTSSPLLKVETARWNDIAGENQIGTQCRQDTVEDEDDFLFECYIHACKSTKYFLPKIKTKKLFKTP